MDLLYQIQMQTSYFKKMNNNLRGLYKDSNAKMIKSAK